MTLIRSMAQSALMRLTDSCVDLTPARLTPGQSTILMRMLNEPDLRAEMSDLIDTHTAIVKRHAEGAG